MAWRIKTVVERTGVPAETLRSWERRYKVLRPARSKSGYRQYSDDDVALVQRLKGLVDSGLSISEAIERCRADVPAMAPRPEHPMREARRRLLKALLDLDEAAATAELVRLHAIPWETLVGDVLLPVGREARFLASQGQATRAEAAHARGWLRDRVVAMRTALGAGEGPAALALRLDGGSELAQQGLALCLRLRGWRVRVVSEALPLVDAAPLLGRLEPTLVLLCLDPDASAAEQRVQSGRLEALVPSAQLRVHGATAPGPTGRAEPIRDPSELPRP